MPSLVRPHLTGTSPLPSVVGKVYGRVLVERIQCVTESMVGEEQSGIKIGKRVHGSGVCGKAGV